MDINSSFAYSSLGLDRIVESEEKLAGYYTLQDVLKHQKYNCKGSFKKKYQDRYLWYLLNM